MIEEDIIAQSHFAKIISRSEIAHAGPARLALCKKIRPRIRRWLLFHQPERFHFFPRISSLSFRAKSRMERLGKPRHGREGRRLSEREVSESNPAAKPEGYGAGSFE